MVRLHQSLQYSLAAFAACTYAVQGCKERLSQRDGASLLCCPWQNVVFAYSCPVLRGRGNSIAPTSFTSGRFWPTGQCFLNRGATFPRDRVSRMALCAGRPVHRQCVLSSRREAHLPSPISTCDFQNAPCPGTGYEFTHCVIFERYRIPQFCESCQCLQELQSLQT